MSPPSLFYSTLFFCIHPTFHSSQISLYPLKCCSHYACIIPGSMSTTPGIKPRVIHSEERERETLSTRLGDAGVSWAFASRCIQIVAMAMVMAAASHTQLLSAPRVRALAATMILLTHATPALSLRRRSCIAPIAMGGGSNSSNSSRALRWRPLPSAGPLSTRRFRHADCANRSSSSVQVDSGVQVAEKQQQQQQEKESVVESRPPSFQQAIQRLQVSGV